MGEAASFVYCFIEVPESREMKCAPKYPPYLPTPLQSLSVVLAGWPGTHYVNQAGLELIDYLLFFPPKCWD